MFPNASILALPETGETVGTGWVPSPPSFKDYTQATPQVQETLTGPLAALTGDSIEQLLRGEGPANALPSKVDLRQWCTRIENQQNLGSCSAFAGLGIMEYLENRAFGTHVDGSPLFIYKATRNLVGWRGDTGAYLRTTMGAIALLGVPPEKHWPYTTAKDPGPSGTGRTFDDEPSAFVYAIADNFEGTRYLRHDPVGISSAQALASVKAYLAYGIPSMLGFYMFPSFNNTNIPGGIPFPGAGEQAIAGHAVDAVGYDDSLQIVNTKYDVTTTGALLCRNSWGSAWGDHGYGWLPYEYAVKSLASEFWSVFGMRWAATSQFGL